MFAGWAPGRFPAWARTIRFRLALTYSGLVFGVAALVLAGVYLALSRSLDAEHLDGPAADNFYVSDSGVVKFLGGDSEQTGQLVSAADLDVVQQAVNAGTLDTLQRYSFAALGGLFLFSLVVGWWVSGRVLRPIDGITRTAREISSSDLSRRIGARGPPDELRTLADTIDDMLGRLQAEFESQRALVAEVSHELRNPVAVVQANVDAVLSDEHASTESRVRAAAVVSRATASVTQLLEDLLATARKRSGAFAETDVELSALARSVVEEYRVLGEEHRVRWNPRLAEGPVVYADELALTRALRNLVANAVRFSPGGGVITVAVGSRRGWAWVAVRDEGPGIAPEEQARIFDRFYSAPHRASHGVPGGHDGAPDAGRRGEGGHGIGLAIARQIVEAHDGRLTVRSVPGAGSTFVIWLPERAALASGERDAAPPVGEDPLA